MGDSVGKETEGKRRGRASKEMEAVAVASAAAGASKEAGEDVVTESQPAVPSIRGVPSDGGKC